jgi:serine/threonine-protein kinase Stk1
MTEAKIALDLLAGRYHLERVLGTGGMGVVYRARDLLHEQFGEPCSRVALKVVGDGLAQASDAHVLLYSEFAVTRSLRHERIVRAFSFEVDTARQVAFFTMELLPGLTLDRLLLECPGGLPWPQLQPLAVQVLDALAYAHGQGVLHGDLKPGNVMVGEAGIRLFDFGLGLGDGLPQLSRDRFNAWTPAYAAPELADGGALTPAADLYGVACMLYELAEGDRPADFQPLKPRKLPRQCWPALKTALAVDPERRAISVAELRETLARDSRRWYL